MTKMLITITIGRWFGHALIALAAALCAPAFAQEYPARAVKIIVPYAPGGQPDVAVRVLAQQFSIQFGQPFVIENIPGSSGIAAINTFLKAPADGYTISYGDAGHWAINVALNSKVGYDPLRDFVPVGLFGETTGLFLCVTDSVPVNNLQELIALAKAKPGALSYASAGIGSIHHLIMEDFRASLGLSILHVPYKGSAQAVPALVGGQVSMALASLAVVSPYARDGKLKILGVSTGKRSSLAPAVPTIAEIAIPGFDHAGGLGLVARVGTPQAVVDKLTAALARAVAMPEVVSRFATVGLEPIRDNSPAKLAERMREDRIKYARVVRLSGATAE
ncbi:MAG: tripartite tricarboxylate transporter substrate binding protein [Betaproteobacteria bacterium]|nr:tripartite tricarboxylate transporter substrate binding protein [Betaproteobacteria bacterium]